MMKKLLLTIALLLLANPATAATTAYRDAQENIYIDGLRADALITVQYSGASVSNRYKSAFMYRKEGVSCQVHTLWESRKKLSFGNWRIEGTPAGVITVSGLPFNASNVPCNGTGRNTAFTWKQVSPGVYAYQTSDACRFTYQTGDDAHPTTACKAGRVAYIFGLPGSAYLVKDSSAKLRFSKVNSCGILKLPNTGTWKAFANDEFSIRYKVNNNLPFTTYKRSTIAIKPAKQIPKCFDGIKFLPAL